MQQAHLRAPPWPTLREGKPAPWLLLRCVRSSVHCIHCTPCESNCRASQLRGYCYARQSEHGHPERRPGHRGGHHRLSGGASKVLCCTAALRTACTAVALPDGRAAGGAVLTDVQRRSRRARVGPVCSPPNLCAWRRVYVSRGLAPERALRRSVLASCAPAFPPALFLLHERSQPIGLHVSDRLAYVCCHGAHCRTSVHRRMQEGRPGSGRKYGARTE